MAHTSAAPTEVERVAHYRELAVQFREWAKRETNRATHASLPDLAGQYERLATELTARIDAALAKRD